MNQRPPLPPFSLETAIEKVRKAENAWNTRDPAQVALGYSADSIWRNRAEFLVGREAIVAFLTRKWNRELDYRLGLFTKTGSRCALPMSGTMTASIGFAVTAMKTGNSMLTG